MTAARFDTPPFELFGSDALLFPPFSVAEMSFRTKHSPRHRRHVVMLKLAIHAAHAGRTYSRALKMIAPTQPSWAGDVAKLIQDVLDRLRASRAAAETVLWTASIKTGWRNGVAWEEAMLTAESDSSPDKFTRSQCQQCRPAECCNQRSISPKVHTNNPPGAAPSSARHATNSGTPRSLAPTMHQRSRGILVPHMEHAAVTSKIVRA